jgi:hypothetical protein
LRVGNLFVAAGSVCNLISIVVLVHLHAGLVALVIASSASQVGANLCRLPWLWYFYKPWLLRRVAHLKTAAARRMMKTGGEFFVMQIAGLVVFNSDNVVLTHLSRTGASGAIQRCMALGWLSRSSANTDDAFALASLQ